ncbi:MAG: hypothetical protein K2Z80_35840 [Xanthobacteraceae bacterium]|nr:hypothetical protein [Xanthobacteraceae bacterium]
MLVRLTKSSRIYAAGVLALVYSFLVVLPTFASTFVDDVAAAGCLTHTVAGSPAGAADVAANDHDADDGISRTDQSEPRGPPCGTCCGVSCGCAGLSCDTALLGRSFSDVLLHPHSQVIARLQQNIERQATAFIDRPPKFIISL